MNRNRTLLVATAGALAGLLIGFVLPAAWLFEDARSHEAHGGDGATKYACPMFCTVMDELPADGRCPVCGMQLNPVSQASVLNGHEQGMIGLEAARLARLPLVRTIRVVGEVDYDETRIARITTRMAGWLERVWADTTWAPVAKGDRLASIYSPELYAAQQEFLVARGGDAMLRSAAERKLRLLGIGDEEIAELSKRGRAQESIVLRAPRDGVVIERHAVEGEAVRKGARLYSTADLSHVWVQAEVFERDLVWIFEGQPVRLRAAGEPEEIAGRVAFIDPALDRRTRTARVRIEVENPAAEDGTRRLRIGQRVDAWIDATVDAHGNPQPPAGSGGAAPLAVPRSAVLSTGNRHVVYFLFTERDGVRDYRIDPERLPARVSYQLVPVRVGPGASAPDRIDDAYLPLIAADLSAAERTELQMEKVDEGMVVVTNGNLLLDSQAQLSGKPSLLFPEGSRGSTDPHAGH